MEQTRMTEQESLKLISDTINKVKSSYYDTGIGPILWGCVVTICSIVSYYALTLHKPALFNIWFLTLFAIAPQIYISIKEKKEKKFVSLTDEVMAAIWTTFGFSMFALSVISNKVEVHSSIYMLVYGFPTIITGWVAKFKVMAIGGVICWLLAIASAFVPYPYPFLLMAAAAIVAWLIPGLILNSRYRKQKQTNV